jgi:hypothetical protein
MSTDGHFDAAAVAATMKSFVEVGLLQSIPKDKELYTEYREIFAIIDRRKSASIQLRVCFGSISAEIARAF